MAPKQKSKRKAAPANQETTTSKRKKTATELPSESAVEVPVESPQLQETEAATLDQIVDQIEEDTTSVEAAAEETDAKPPAEVQSSETTNAHWNQMLFELISFKSKTGRFVVKPHGPQHKALHDWIRKQREQYRKFQSDPSTSALTEEQIGVLDYVQFPWIVRGAELWKQNYERLKKFHKEHGHTMVSRTHTKFPRLADWSAEQRRQYKFKLEGKTTTLTEENQNLLEQLGFTWKIRDRPGWDKRYGELLEFKEKHGHAKVPQHYSPNRQLGKWVAKQREQYRLSQSGKHSFLTPARLEQLNSVGFVWKCKGGEPAKDAKKAAKAAPAVKEKEDVEAPVAAEVQEAATSVAVSDGKDDAMETADNPAEVTTKVAVEDETTAQTELVEI